MTKKIIHLNSGLMVKDLFFKDGGERDGKLKPSHLHSIWWVMCLGKLRS
jgi:hypothetical protein